MTLQISGYITTFLLVLRLERGVLGFGKYLGSETRGVFRQIRM